MEIRNGFKISRKTKHKVTQRSSSKKVRVRRTKGQIVSMGIVEEARQSVKDVREQKRTDKRD